MQGVHIVYLFVFDDLCLRAGIAIARVDMNGGGWFYCRGITVGGEGGVERVEVEGRIGREDR